MKAILQTYKFYFQSSTSGFATHISLGVVFNMLITFLTLPWYLLKIAHKLNVCHILNYSYTHSCNILPSTETKPK